MTEDKVEAMLAQARAQGVEIGIDRAARTMHLSFPKWMEADLYADVIRRDNRDDPVEAARQIWHEVAPILRECGWSDEKIIREYEIPEAVLSGEADRLANVSWAMDRLSRIERDPDRYFRGEPALIAAFRAGEIDADEFASRLSGLAIRAQSAAHADAPDVPEDDIRVQVVSAGDEDEIVVIVDHRPTWRRYRTRAARRFVDDYVAMLRKRLSMDVDLLARGEEPIGEDVFTPEEERHG